MKWWQSNPILLENFKREISDFPYLNLTFENDKIFLYGDWPVYGNQYLIKKYSIKIEIPDDYPKTVPNVFEIGGTIPKIADRHFNSGDHAACLFIKTERQEHWPLGSGIDIFLTGPVKQFFFSQAYYELTGKWPFGYWAHSYEGLLEYCLNYMQLTKSSQLEKFLKYFKAKKPAKLKCPCDNGKLFKVCHWDQFATLRTRLSVKEWMHFANHLAKLKR